MKRAALVFLSCLPFSALSQTVTDVKLFDKNTATFMMRIDGTPYAGITEAQWKEFRRIARERDELKDGLTRAEQDIKNLQDARTKLTQAISDQTAVIKSLQDVAASSQKLSEDFSETSRKLTALNKEYAQMVNDYQALAKKYRDVAVTASPRQAIDLGMGFVHAGESNHIVGMAGAGADVFGLGVRGWVFGGQSTYGAMLGVSF